MKNTKEVIIAKALELFNKDPIAFYQSLLTPTKKGKKEYQSIFK